MEQRNTPLFDLQIDHESSSFLNQAAKWGRFISIVGFIMVGLMIVFAFSITTFLNSFPNSSYGATDLRSIGSALGGMVTFFYVVIALVWLMPLIYLFRFSSKMLAALKTRDQVLINQAFGSLKSCFKFVGVVTIIILSIYALAFVLFMGAFVIGAAGK